MGLDLPTLLATTFDFREGDGAFFADVLDYFQDISFGRGYSMSGALPISHQEIRAWCELHVVVLTRLQLVVLRAIDMIYLEVVNKHDDKRGDRR